MFRKLIVAMVVMTATTAAQALDFKVLADRKVDFKDLATYKIDDVKIIRTSGAKVKKANVDALRAAVEQKLQEEGLSASDSSPDVRVSVVAGTEEGMQPSNTQAEPYFDGQWRVLPKQGGEDSEAPDQPMTYNQATLRIDIKNAKTGDVIWRAVANDVVKLPVSRKFVDATLHQIFEQFPPPAAQ
ncbi:MAG: DUF4136 domain-containing protein [Moraxellaceae bacterium]